MTPHAIGGVSSLHLGEVTDNADPEGRGRVKVRLHGVDMELWAAVVVSSAGSGYGASFIPRRQEVVVLAFVTPELPLVLGSIWSGQGSVPDEAEPQEERYVVRTPAGTVLEFDDGEGPRLEIRTPQGHRLTVTDGNGGEVELARGGQSVKMTASEVSVRSTGEVKVDAASITVSAGMVTVNAGMSKFSGVVQADTVITNAVVSSSYTPGAGNVW
ncbi:VgrG protein [Thioalkalivibrio nitratireducens DSM 14787]|uniref:VgrG protein n=1 Tax=Thioalkalivibrio nitratireducens (strain DSM 14787 / UNIQEM 213 / ALEN2) TaxID=1255043 RepID=L0DZH6_THIND|nr:phage baseplate assembly protein V [Thioalkalivibrio nitratireducens]AGA33796.1 VgrG protein [Thioalkalivibrio nitratireducens DSM 14787]